MVEAEAPRPEDGAARERGLVRLCLAGDGAAQRELVRRYAPLVWSACCRAGLPAAEAEDVSQDVFSSAFLALPRFRGECRLSTWFYTLALRRLADHLRAPSRRDVPAGIPSSREFPEPRQAPPPSPETQAVETQRRERVRAALDDLAEPVRSILLAYYLGEMPVAEIARALSIPEGTVKTHLHRGRKTLRGQLRDLC